MFVLSIICLMMCSISLVYSNAGERELSSGFKYMIEQVAPRFQEDVIRAFNNEGVRNALMHNKNHYNHKMDNILVFIGDTKIELSKLIFPWTPDFRIVNLTMNFSMLCLDVNLKLGDLRVKGDFEGYNITLQNLLPAILAGKIEQTFKDVVATGRIGFLIRGDSMVLTNYDIKYEPSETDISVKYYASNGSEVETKRTKQNSEKDSLRDAVWVELSDILTRLLHSQLGEVLVERSLTELLLGEDENLRDLAREHSQRANKLLDTLLCTAKDYIVDKNYRLIETPLINAAFKEKPSGLSQGAFQTGYGFIKDLSTLSRVQDLSLYEDKQRLVVYGSLTLREFKHGYDHYSCSFEDIVTAGQVKATIYNNKIFVKVTLLKEGERCKTQLDNIRVSTIRDIDVDASRLASLIWLAPRVERWVIGNLRHIAVPVLEKHITEAFNYAIGKTDCVSLLINY
ncbi:uncharacterized protein LOC108903462 isoform X2 [Anoplophora glabripennis]|uniref:uncharacterized protein LOC108903462 isoform X2 n=1 Tax=Anoplophora glabripennis TaxID=217634 RepID=UPI00087486B1|nr:uncharacterized protein LOC108903462 isoform X2 [Anoplophora glabripennis]